MLKTHPPLLLASKSPRRQDLLRAAGIDFKLIDVDVEESYPDDMLAELVPEFLARKKAEAAMPLIESGHLILAADSVVIKDGEIYGKPENRDHAIEMTKILSGHHHTVITGVFICNHHKGIGFSEYTEVWIEHMTSDEIEYYIDHFLPLDKAGAYGIQDWIGWVKVSRIEGSYANVMGLPVHKVYEVLNDWNED
ncbi:MAG: septum formation protein Maf [Saprospiraceae bacterium]|uniref:dTTP/UTP pyrophosphatase n=1 Tax=Candidatus Opimibacter skivensis TaxID=2982028 RepID=A0A9D7ST70_9BACT|nr:septum formation protein Maf [Candidatus Opimibacter skivensis]